MRYLDRQIDQDSIIIIDDFIEKYLIEQQIFFKGNFDAERKIRHTYSCCKIFDILAPDYAEPERELVRLAVKAHDIGRFKQLEMIGSYDDNIVHHSEIGANIIESAIDDKLLSDSLELRSIQLIIKYHGLIEFLDKKMLRSMPQGIVEWTRLVTVVDDLENVCITAPTRLESEVINDTKHLVRVDIDQTCVSPNNMMTYYQKRKIDRKNCKTYADYVLFHLSVIRRFLFDEKYEQRVIALLSDEAYLRYIEIIRRFISPRQATEIAAIFERDFHKSVKETYCTLPSVDRQVESQIP